MLLIGDYAINRYTGLNISTIEIVYIAKHFDYIKNYFNISDQEEIKVNTYTTKYELKNFVTLILYKANEVQAFRQLLEDEFALGNTFKVASPNILFKKLYILTPLMHKDVNTWVNNVKAFTKISRDYIFNRLDHDNNIIKRLELNAIKLYVPLLYSDYTELDYDEDKSFTRFTEESIHNLFESSSVNRNYLDITCTYNSSDIERSKWNNLQYLDKMYCCLEKIYAIAADEFLIKYIKSHDCIPLPRDLYNIFLKSYMIFVNISADEVLTKFLIFNFEKILLKYDRNYAVVLYNALDYGDLIPV